MAEIRKDNQFQEEVEEVLGVIEEEEVLVVIEEVEIVEDSMVIEEEVAMIATIKAEKKMKENMEVIKEETIVVGTEEHLAGILILKLIQ